MTEKERKLLQESIESLKQQKQEKEDSKLIQEAKSLGIDVDKIIKKQENAPQTSVEDNSKSSSEKIENTSINLEEFGQTLAKSIASAIKGPEQPEEKEELTELKI